VASGIPRVDVSAFPRKSVAAPADDGTAYTTVEDMKIRIRGAAASSACDSKGPS
jgi:hypothetical protein